MNNPSTQFNQKTDYGSAQFFGDFHGGNQTINLQQKSDFKELTLEELKSRELKKNLETDNLLKILQDERLLVLGGDIGIEKNDLASEIAYYLGEEILIKVANLPKDTKLIKRWKRTSNQQIIDIDLELQETNLPTIFIINELSPIDVKLNLLQLYKTVKSSKHYIIATTDESLSSWHLVDEAKNIFPDLTEVNFYSQDDLLHKLNEQIEKYEISQELKDKLSSDEEQDNLQRYLKYTFPIDFLLLLRLIAEDLRTFRNIIRFVELFRSSKSLSIVQLIESAKSDGAFINQLYNYRLNPREQLLALGLSFFNGLFEDQLFAALEKIVQIAWQKRDASLRALDYCDLEKLQNDFFNLTNNELSEGKPEDFKVVKTNEYRIDIRSITVISLSNRRKLLEIAWESHRRQIIAALPGLVDLVEESVKIDYRQWELYGSFMRCQKLRDVISDTLSEIALISTSATSAVQSALITLARNNNFFVQNVAAKSIGRWRDPNVIHNEHIKPNQELFRTLQLFYSLAIDQEKEAQKTALKKLEKPKLLKNITQQNFGQSIIALLKLDKLISKPSEPEENQESKPESYYIEQPKLEKDKEDYIITAYIAATVALTIMYAAKYDNNRISDDLFDWLKELSQSKIFLVHKYYGNYTLYYLTPLYLTQLRNLLQESIQNHKKDHLNYAIARSLSHAYDYPNNRVEVANILEEWHKKSIKIRSSSINVDKITAHDALLKTVALTYGLIDYTLQPSNLQLNHVISRLDGILEQEKHPFVRQGVIQAVYILICKYFHEIESQLQDLLTHIQDDEPDETDEIIKALTIVYLTERENFQGGDQQIKVYNRSYSVWTELKKRPLTAIEKVMDSWVKLERKRVAQKIAIKALVSFSLVLDEINLN